MSNLDMDDFLEHYGVKGMHWGVRKEDPSGSGRRSRGNSKKPALNHDEKAVLSKLGLSESDSNRMQAKYGANSTKKTTKPKKPFKLTEGQKRLAVLGAKIAVAGAAYYGLKKLGQVALEKQVGIGNSPKQMKEFWRGSNKTKLHFNNGFSRKEVESFTDNPLTFKPGDIVKRVSMARETEIRPDGFYAAFKDDDVTRYKAALPCYWKLWGNQTDSGHVVSLKVMKEIKAPSRKETFGLMQEMLDEKDALGQTYREHLKEMVPPTYKGRKLADDELVRRAMPQAALMWIDPAHGATSMFMRRVKAKGYNALVDINDAGSLGESPMRFLDGSMFEIAGHESLTKAGIAQARAKVMEVAHAIIDFLNELTDRRYL